MLALILPCIAFSFTHQSHHVQWRHGRHIMLHDVAMKIKVSRSMTGSFCWLKRAVSKHYGLV